MVLRRRKGSDKVSKPAPGTEIVMLQDEHGLLLNGSPVAVATTVEWLTSIEPAAVRSRSSGADIAAMAATGTALATSSEYVRLTDAGKSLLQEHGAIPGASGTFRGFVKDAEGHFAGILDFKPAGFGPERALALQSAAIGLALRTAIAEVHEAVERVEGKVDRIAALLEAERLGRALGDRRTLQPLAERLAATGNLSMTDWDSVASLGPQIARDIEALRAHIRRQLAEIDRRFTPGARAETVDDLLDDQFLTETLALLLVAEDNHRLWQEIRLANVRLREPEHLADHLADAQASINTGIREDQALVDALGRAAGELLPPNPADGLSLIGNRQLAKAEVRLHDLMEWFADQRLLDVAASDLHERPGFRDSVGYLGSKGLGFAKALPPAVSRIARRNSDADPEPLEPS